MMLALFNPSMHVDQMVDLLLTILQPVFWTAVCLGFVLAGAHFLTMLATRWGERRVSSKALLFSLGVHLSMGCGLVAMIPEYRGRLLRFLDENTPEPIEIEAVIYESPQTTRELRSGNTPLWDELADTPLEDLTRFDRTREPIEPDQGPVPRPEPVQLDQRHLEDVRILPEQPAEVPEQQRAAVAGLEQQAVLPLETESPEPLAREDVVIPSAQRERREIAASDAAEESALDKPEYGSVDRVRPDYIPEPDIASIQARNQEIARLQQRDDDTDIRNREAPAVVPLDVEETGRIEQPDASGGAASGAREVTRTVPRSPESAGSTLPVRQQFETPPRTPKPLDENPLAALDGQQRDVNRPPVLPELERQNFEPLRRSDLSQVPATYQLRSVEDRKLATREFGGTQESEQAVENALKWLASTQEADGSWDAGRYGAGTAKEAQSTEMRPNAGGNADSGITALAVLAFLGAGHTPDNGEYAVNVRRALVWLIRQQDRDGYLGGKADFVAGMYSHGMAAFSLAEAHAMMTDTADTNWLRQPLVLAVNYIVAQQLSDGSWRYVQRQNEYGDMSMFGWQLMALKSAETGGVAIPSSTKQGMVKFLNDMSRGQSGGLAAYRSIDPVSPTMTAEALFCKQMLGLNRSHASSDEATHYLMQNLPSLTSMNYYYWYYGTLATFQYGGEPWRRWNEQLRDLLVAEQLQRGQFAGSWEPRGVWGKYGGRIYTTAVATLCLEVYYRYLPLYKTGGRYDATGE